MSLDPTNTHPLYLLGRLVALTEQPSGPLPADLLALILGQPLAGLGRLKDRLLAAKDQRQIEHVMGLINPAAMPKGPLPEAAKAHYWAGYHAQRRMPRHATAVGPEVIARAGQALAGDRYQTDLARLLGWDSARVRQIMSKQRPLPTGAALEIVAALRRRAAEADAIADELLRLLQEGESALDTRDQGGEG